MAVDKKTSKDKRASRGQKPVKRSRKAVKKKKNLAWSRKVAGKKEKIDDIQSRKISLQEDRMDKNGPFGFSNKKQQLLWATLQPQMKNITTMTFDEVMIGGEDHPIPRSSLSRKAEKRLNKIGEYDLEELFSLRFGNLIRVYGIREGNVFKILWLDSKHKICPTNK